MLLGGSKPQPKFPRGNSKFVRRNIPRLPGRCVKLRSHLMKKTPQITYDTVRQMALALPNVVEGTSYGTPALKVKGQLIVRLREDLDSIVLKMPFDRREELMAGDPETYYITDHYREYEWVLVRLAKVNADALRDLLQIAYRAASALKPRRRR